MGLDITFTDLKTNKEMYFRKVPRIVPSVLKVKEEELEIKNNALVGNCNVIKKNDSITKEQWKLVYSGELNKEQLEDVMKYAASNKYINVSGFFGGENKGTTDEELKRDFKKFIKLLDDTSVVRYKLDG